MSGLGDAFQEAAAVVLGVLAVYVLLAVPQRIIRGAERVLDWCAERWGRR